MREVYEYVSSKAISFVINNWGKISFCTWTIVVIMPFVLNIVVPIGYFIFFTIYFIACAILPIPILNKMIKNLFIDFYAKQIKIERHRSYQEFVFDFDEIEAIKINGYLTIRAHSIAFWLKEYSNIELLLNLNKVKKLQYGWLCNIWGPSKDVQNKIEKSSQQ